MRRILGLLAVIGLLAATFPASTAAAPPTRASATQTGILCELTSEAGFVSLLVETAGSEGTAYLALWAPGTEPYLDDPSVVTADGRASLEGSSLRAGFDLVAFADGREAGSASLGAELTASGAPMSFPDEGTDGNRRFRSDHVLQLLSVAGTVAIDLLDGTHVEIGLESCGASTDSLSFFATNPNAWVYGGDQLFISCEWAVGTASIELFGLRDDFMSLSQLVVVSGDRVALGIADHELSPTAYAASFDLVDLGTGEPLPTAVADATLSASGDRINDHRWDGDALLSTIGDRLTIEGAITLSVDGEGLELPMDDGSCRAGDVTVKVVQKVPAG